MERQGRRRGEAALAGKLIVNVDGGARGNPGPAAVAAVASTPDGEVVAERGELIGSATNNVAEYRAVLLGIETARALDASELELVCDSELVVRQLRGDYRVKQQHLRPLHARAQKELMAFPSWTIRHVRRDENAAADGLVNATLDAA
jgi:ribonuclease HI